MLRWIVIPLLTVAGLVVAAALVLSGIALVQIAGYSEAEVSVDPAEAVTAVPDGEEQRVLLDVKSADVRFVPGPAGSQPVLKGSYDERYFELEQTSDPTNPPTWHIRFRRTGGGGEAMQILRELFGHVRPRLEVQWPQDQPLQFAINGEGSVTRAEFGGLTVSKIEGEFAHGLLEISFSKESPAIDTVDLDVRQTTFRVDKLGNASPSQIDLQMVMGTSKLDFAGAWRRNASIHLESEMQAGELTLPDDVLIEGIESGLNPGAAGSEVPPLTLRFEVDNTLGLLQIASPDDAS